MDILNFRSAAALILVGCLLPVVGNAQAPRTKNIIIVTLDGFRWQEFFKGADPAVVQKEKYVTREQIRRFLDESTSTRRKLLMPFIWDRVSHEGQLYGNRDLDNEVNCKNHHLLSYPGYSEMLVGFAHGKISSNESVENPHATVLEAIENHASFQNEVAAFTTWGTFSYILREARSGIYLNAGQDLAEGDLSIRERLLNKHHVETGVRSDSLTFQYAMEYLKRKRPRVTFIGLDETDQHAHAGRYGQYLTAAHRADRMIGQLWEWVQSQPDYRDQTTLFITTDHGRGNGKNNWRVHRLLAAGSRHIWFAVMGPDTPAFGEMKIKSRVYQNQVAKTLAAFLGLPYHNQKPVGEAVQTMMAVPKTTSEEASASNRFDD